MENKNYKKETNPTYYTAKGTLYMLTKADNAEAKEFMKLIDMSDLISGINENGNIVGGLTDEIAERMSRGLGSAVELRYNIVSKALLDSKLKNFLDVACGYTPRGLFCKNNNIDYIGVDVPIVVEEMNDKVGDVVKNGKHIPYMPVDVTNPSTIIKAAENLQGEVFISCEGLIMYLSMDELHEFLSGIKGILARHGGAWITSDLGIDYAVAPLPFINDKKAEEELLERSHTLKDTSDIKYFSNNFKNEDEKKRFFENEGFKIEKLPIKDMNLVIKQLEKESDEIKERVKKYYDTLYCWKLTLDDNEKIKLKNLNNFDNKVKINHKLENGKLSINVEGRLDTLSSPELLEAYDIESQNGTIDSITIDASKLEYISSAGLRVILKMSKALKSHNIVICGANEVVKEIFKTTGFDKFVSI